MLLTNVFQNALRVQRLLAALIADDVNIYVCTSRTHSSVYVNVYWYMVFVEMSLFHGIERGNKRDSPKGEREIAEYVEKIIVYCPLIYLHKSNIFSA